jgi:hypothetical protein
MFERDRFLRLGGFRDLPRFEDWDVWLRFWLDGAKIVPSDAVYIIHTSKDGRNQDDRKTFNEIIKTYEPLARTRGLI